MRATFSGLSPSAAQHAPPHLAVSLWQGLWWGVRGAGWYSLDLHLWIQRGQRSLPGVPMGPLNRHCLISGRGRWFGPWMVLEQGFQGHLPSSSAHFLLVPLTLSKSLFSTSAPAPCPTPATPRLLPFLPLAFYTASPLTSAGILPVMQSLCPDGQRDEFGFLQYANST